MANRKLAHNPIWQIQGGIPLRHSKRRYMACKRRLGERLWRRSMVLSVDAQEEIKWLAVQPGEFVHFNQVQPPFT